MTQAQKNKSDYSQKERETAILRSANAMFLREFWSGSQSPYLTEKGKYFLKEIFPKPITRGELEALLTPVHPEQEFNFRDYVREMETLLIRDPSPLENQLFYQHLAERVEKLAKELDDYNLTLTNFHTLLGIYVLNLAVEQELVSRSEKRYYFIRNNNTPQFQ